MRSRNWDAIVITSSDPHSSEYPADRWKQVQWITGFTGEAGDVVITLDHAGLWTDTRYFIQANEQLAGTGVELHKTRVPDQVLIPQWLSENLEEDATIAIDGLCVGADFVAELNGNIVSVPDILGSLWKDRPTIPQTPIFTVEAGQSRESKIEELRKFLRSRDCSALLLSSLDEIAWALNVRASDIDYNPLVISYLLISEENIKWYVVKDRVEDPDTLHTFEILENEGISILPYNEISFLTMEIEGRLFVDSSTLNFELYNRLVSESVVLEEGQSPVILRKAVKNAYEIGNMRECHIDDGVAVEIFLYSVEKALAEGQSINEWDAARILGRFRQKIDDYQGDSFETISAYGLGAALPHYITPKQGAARLEAKGLYLCDSGGQFLRGTTDITRTVALGPCSRIEMEDYTLVLKGHIALAKAVFPAGTAGCQLDCLARSPLWNAHRNFGHGTGHGVGYFLGVHEGPQDIRQNFNRTPLTPGMVVSIEPGIYREGSHGVRHENLVCVVEDSSNEFGHWLRFEELTLCHFDTSALILDLLSKDEIEWLNNYNEKVYQTLSARLPEEVSKWLREKTLSICIN